MAAVASSLAMAINGTVTGTGASGIGLDSDNDWVIKSAAFILQFNNPTENTSGYGDGGWSTFNKTALSGSFTVAGWMESATNCQFDPDHLGEEYDDTVFTCDTGITYTGAIVLEQARIDHRYNRNIPVQLSGKFTVTTANPTVAAIPASA